MNSPKDTTILIIEDDESVRQTLSDMLEMNGFRTVTAEDGLKGYAAAKTEPVSLVITDISMPGMTGFDLLEAFRSDPQLRSVPVIVISAKVDRADTRRGMELGADDFITKPFSEEEVIHSIAARLEKKELLDELDAFAHTVAHDLKNPLATLSGRIEMAAMMVGQADDATLRHQLSEAAVSANRLSNIIEELLVLAGVRRQRIKLVAVDMSAVVAESIARLESLVKRYNGRVTLPESWPVAVGHAPWVAEIWCNYLSNALKYGGSDPQLTLGAEPTADGHAVRFWVQDTGPGLDAAAQQKMFVPFTQISTVRASGHGLGLSIVRRIAEKLEGRVGVISSPGHGARFWFELPKLAKTFSRPPEPPLCIF